ncbi:group II intron reverse transcriptase/maturase [Clostridium sp. ZS2-4]|uniref:group II intron reverse transcriptase/maturase n=1 Tax=Clostridium sp. ZS2-4 TaxID=2987703 RepID=UPI00227C70FF|nr:group II intron reverse transcriptase/maturase [Clostridium sp. ZS2-4]MCY6355362.1 group II intron reverse transcriptase/maturase [Clostridium sp. ZS2-4]
MNAKANNTTDKVRELQRKLYLSAKVNKKRRFHALYDKIYRKDILFKAWKQVKSNGGTGGIDKIFIKDVVEYGENKFLEEIQDELTNNNYSPKPVKRVYIPKKDGKKRPLGIPILKDRVVQMATKIVIEPIFEANFKENSFGFRPKRNAHQALDLIRRKCNNKGWWVLDADIKSYFDNINHNKLMILIEQKISDRRILKLIRKWLKVGIIENGEYKESLIGSPQGGVISPLLSNIYLNYLDTAWEKYYSHLGTLIRYCDDFIVISRTKKEINHACNAIKLIMRKLELELHPEKTKFVNLWDGKEGFDFLGFHHRRTMQENGKGQIYPTTIQFPSKKAMTSMREKLKQILNNRATLKRDIKEMIKIINRRLRGFKNYYGLKYASKHLNKIDWYVIEKFTIWNNHKRQIRPRRRGLRKMSINLKVYGIVKLAT